MEVECYGIKKALVELRLDSFKGCVLLGLQSVIVGPIIAEE